MSENKSDLRVIRTKKAIRQTFRQMICEMDYSDITVRELCRRAMINRKTFYLHYSCLDDLLQELQDEAVSQFLSQNPSFTSKSDIRKMIRSFFESAAEMPDIYERILCSGTMMADEIFDKMMARRENSQGALSTEDRLMSAWFFTSVIQLYRAWVKDGKKIPLKQLTADAQQLICSGLDSFLN